MSFFKKIFGKQQQEKSRPDAEENLPWIEHSDNPWGIRLLDLRPISQTMLSTSKNQQMAENAISYNAEDGKTFWGQKPAGKSIPAEITIPIDRFLAPGVLFIPSSMENKWAIYFDGKHLIFVRSWLREVFVVARTSQKDNELIVEEITGEFSESENPEFTKAVLNFLLISHSINENVPAPLPKNLEENPRQAGLWAFSMYGNRAHFGTFDETFRPAAASVLRSHSLLHIAVAKFDTDEMEKQIAWGTDVDAIAAYGLATLHWSIAHETTGPMQKLLDLGANPNVKSTEGATPLMNAVQSNKINHLNQLLNSGASVNARDDRGFTALHRAAERGHAEITEILLANGADKTVEAEGNTALSLAKMRNHEKIISLLSD